MLGLTLATSNVSAMYRPRSDWQRIYDSQTTEGISPPNELAEETDEAVDDYIKRIDAGFATLRKQLDAYRPDVVVVLGYDDGTAFSGVQIPQICTFTGPEMTGSTAVTLLGEKPEDHNITFACNPEFAWEMHGELVDRGFDLSYMSIQNPLGRPEMGTSSAFTQPAKKLLDGLGATIVPIFINCMVEPTPTGHRMFAFGQALGEILEDSPGKVALLAVGGLSHDPNGDRAGWIDNRMDRFILDQIEKGRAERLKTLFDVDSDTVRGGTGQIRTWVAAAAAAERVHEERGLDRTQTTATGTRRKHASGTVADYIPALRAMTGIGFAFWNFD